MAQEISHRLKKFLDETYFQMEQLIPNDDLFGEPYLGQYRQAILDEATRTYKIKMCVESEYEKMDDYPIDDLAIRLLYNLTVDKFALKKSLWIGIQKIIDAAYGESRTTTMARDQSRFVVLLEILIIASREIGGKLRSVPFIRKIPATRNLFEPSITDLVRQSMVDGLAVRLENDTDVGKSIKKFLRQPIVIKTVIRIMNDLFPSKYDGSDGAFCQSVKYMKIYSTDLHGEFPFKAIVVRDGILLFRRLIGGMDDANDSMASILAMAANLFTNYMYMKLSESYVVDFPAFPASNNADQPAASSQSFNSPGEQFEQMIFGRQIDFSRTSRDVLIHFVKIALSENLAEFPNELLQKLSV